MKEAEAHLPSGPKNGMTVSSAWERDASTPVVDEKPLDSPSCSAGSVFLASSPLSPLFSNGNDQPLKSPPLPRESRKKPPSKKKAAELDNTFIKETPKLLSGCTEDKTEVFDNPTVSDLPKKDARDCYFDIDTVPRILCPKRPEEEKKQLVVAEKILGKELKPVAQVVKKTGKDKRERSSKSISSVVADLAIKQLANKERAANLALQQKKASNSSAVQSNVMDLHSHHLPASSGLMTRALKASEENEEARSVKEEEGLSPHRDLADILERRWQSKLVPDADSESARLTFSPPTRSPPTSPFSKLTRSSKLDKSHVFNGTMIRSEDVTTASSDHPSVGSVQVKQESIMSDISSTSFPSPCQSPIESPQDGKDLSLKSHVKDEGESGKGSGRSDSSYHFSTFLMLLKDLHDTREKEGKPLTLPQPPSSSLIKEEPSLIPGPAGDEPLEGVAHETDSSSSTLHGTKAQNGKCAKSPPSKASNTRPSKTKSKSSAKKDAPRNEGKNVPAMSHTALLSKTLNTQQQQQQQQHLAADLDALELGLPPTEDLPTPYTFTKFAPKKRWQTFESGTTTEGAKPKEGEQGHSASAKGPLEFNGLFKDGHHGNQETDVGEKKEGSGKVSFSEKFFILCFF